MIRNTLQKVSVVYTKSICRSSGFGVLGKSVLDVPRIDSRMSKDAEDVQKLRVNQGWHADCLQHVQDGFILLLNLLHGVVS